MNSQQLWTFFPIGYMLTVTLEMPFFLLGLTRKHSLKRRFLAGLWLNACSYPIVVLVLPAIIDTVNHRVLYITIAETFAPLLECLLFALLFHRHKELSRRQQAQDFAAIIAANLFSFLFGGWFLYTSFGKYLLSLFFK